VQNTTKTRESRPKERSQSNAVLAQTLRAANQQKFQQKFHVEIDSANPRFLLTCFRTRIRINADFNGLNLQIILSNAPK